MTGGRSASCTAFARLPSTSCAGLASLSLSLSLTLTLTLAACAGGGGPVTVGITQVVGPAGAQIAFTSLGGSRLAGTVLVIPAGALPGDTTVTVSPGSELAQKGEVAVGPSVRLLPDGLMLLKAATLTLPYDVAIEPHGTYLAVEVSGASGRGRFAATVDSRAGTVTLPIAHFSDYETVAIPGTACAMDADCGSGKRCTMGACTFAPVDGGPSMDARSADL